jgi:VWFA-related protein
MRAFWMLPAIACLAAPQQPETVIRSTTRLVQVHVVAVDGQGRPVTDLQREDFQIFDEKKQQPLALFVVEGSPVGEAQAAAEVERGHGYSAILLDWLNAGMAERLRGNDALRKTLRTMQPRQSVALYVLGTEPPNVQHPLRTIWNFREPSEDLAESIADPLALPSPDIAETYGKFDARFGSGSRNRKVEEQIYDWNNRVMDTVRALNDLAGRMSRLPGKKSIVWLTTGFPMFLNGSVIPGAHAAEVSYIGEMERVLAVLNRNDIAVHVVDTRGLSSIGRSFGDTEHTAAERTGGTVFVDRNDLDRGMWEALDDLHAGYTLGFVVPEGAAAGPHRIEVRSKRAHVRLRYRESYDLGSSP